MVIGPTLLLDIFMVGWLTLLHVAKTDDFTPSEWAGTVIFTVIVFWVIATHLGVCQ